jgi:hypothetical protein
MAASDILSQTLSTITSIKLDELSRQRSNFEAGKARLLEDVAGEPNQCEKLAILLGRIEHLNSMGKLDNPLLSLKNVRQFLEQARSDPSVSEKLQKNWQLKLESELDIHSLKYEYASLYGKLVKEWIAASEDTLSDGGSGFETVGRKEMHEQRAIWEYYVFRAKETDAVAIQAYLNKLFGSSKEIKSAYTNLVNATGIFERSLAVNTHFNENTLQCVIKGLLRSDIVTDEKRSLLKDFLNNKAVLGEVADVLNMRMASLDKWKWGPEGTPVEQRRHLNGRYRFYHDEDLLQSILIRYIGIKWSVFFKRELSRFQCSSDVWKSSSTKPPASDYNRRLFFLGPKVNPANANVEYKRNLHFEDDIFLEHLQATTGEQRGGYDDDSVNEGDTRKSSLEITQDLLHVLATEIIIKTRLGEEICVVRSDFKWFGPSLPHSTMLAVLKFFGVSEKWTSFFRRVLEAPIKFVKDGANAPVQIRKRGTPISGPMSDMLGETTLFVLDFAMNQFTDGARLYRLHDDIWFWGQEKTCIKGWNTMIEFAQLMGLEFAEDKTGSVRITRKPNRKAPTSSKLPKGDVRWGLLKLDDTTGKFIIDQDNVDKHTEELCHQLGACKSVFDWIQAWNIYGARYFTTNFGRPANCYGRAHVEMILNAFARIQSKLFASTGGSVTSTLKKMLTDRFGVQDIPEGYLYFPISMGGLNLISPFVNLNLVRHTVAPNPDQIVDDFFEKEEAKYQTLRKEYNTAKDGLGEPAWASRVSSKVRQLCRGADFMSFEEYTSYREQTSIELFNAYTKLTGEPEENEVEITKDVAAIFIPQEVAIAASGRANQGGSVAKARAFSAWSKLSSYDRWIVQLYAPDMIERFGGLHVVEKGLLPTGMISMFRESRFKWQG